MSLVCSRKGEDGLTDRQRAFANHFVSRLSGSESYRRRGTGTMDRFRCQRGRPVTRYARCQAAYLTNSGEKTAAKAQLTREGIVSELLSLAVLADQPGAVRVAAYQLIRPVLGMARKGTAAHRKERW